MFSRFAHLVKALDQRNGGPQDSILERRTEAMRIWNRARFLVLTFLSIGIAATVAGWIAQFLPVFDTAADAVSRLTATASAFSGVLTLAYIFLTRYLGQLEVDILTILLLRKSA